MDEVLVEGEVVEVDDESCAACQLQGPVRSCGVDCDCPYFIKMSEQTE